MERFFRFVLDSDVEYTRFFENPDNGQKFCDLYYKDGHISTMKFKGIDWELMRGGYTDPYNAGSRD